MRVVTAGVMREIERRADGFGLSPAVLMQLAGLAVADEVAQSLGGVRGRRALILVGPGNNGGDGLVAAFRLHDWGARVILYLWSRKREGDENYALCAMRGIESIDVSADVDSQRLGAELQSADVVVDALLGTGLARPVAGTLKGILAAVEDFRKQRSFPPVQLPKPYLVAVDVPTGLNSDTGGVDPLCFAADLTVTLGFPKIGSLLFPGAAKSGRLVTRDIGIPPQLAEDVPTRLLSAEYVRGLLPLRPLDANKGTFGRVLVVGGSANYIGAPCLASLAALRVGAGLVTLACAQSLHSILAAKVTEATFLPLPEAEEGVVGVAAVKPVVAALGNYQVLLIGPGLDRHSQTGELVREVLRNCPPGMKVVVDADALNALSETARWWEGIGAELVLTPHPGEMARLLGKSVDEVNATRPDMARKSAAEWGKVVVLKGAHTLIAEPSGRLNISGSANPALASAGTGDVLSGVIAGLLAQNLDTFAGASAGVYVHAEIGESLRRDLGDAGLLAGDLIDVIPRILKRMRESPDP